MKRIFIILAIISVFSCSPKLRSSLTKELPKLPDSELVVVIDVFDDQITNEEKIGEIKAIDNGFSDNCSYYENIKNLKNLARESGANLVKLTKHKPSDKWSSCHRLWANIYKVNDAKVYETEIEWSSGRKLTWDDFKGTPDLENFPNALAVTNSGFGYQSSGIHLFKKGELFVQAFFYNYGSWVLPEGRTDYVLRHEQIHFDLTEIFSRKLRKELKDANITPLNTVKANTIFERIKKELEKRQKDYDYETKHGLKKETQEEWEAIVELELAKYELYKSN